MKKIEFLSILMLLVCGGCYNRGYVYYLVDPEIEIDESFVNQSTKQTQREIIPPEQVMKVNWNDGKTYAEVQIPIVHSGQRIIVDHQSRGSSPKDNGPNLVSPAPSVNDYAHLAMAQAYAEKGMKENQKAGPVSLSQSQELMNRAISENNYVLALRYIENVLQRYPDHVTFLRAKGSVMLLMGNREEAIKIYEKTQDVEYSRDVEKKLSQLSQE